MAAATTKAIAETASTVGVASGIGRPGIGSGEPTKEERAEDAEDRSRENREQRVPGDAQEVLPDEPRAHLEALDGAGVTQHDRLAEKLEEVDDREEDETDEQREQADHGEGPGTHVARQDERPPAIVVPMPPIIPSAMNTAMKSTNASASGT